MYANPEVADFITSHFIPVRVHVRRQTDAFKQLGARYGAQWTPTILLIDERGAERHRIEGFLPADEFLAQLELGLGHAAFQANEFVTAESHFRLVVSEHPETETAAEALYWTGVSHYKATNDPAALAETAAEFRERYQNTTWAKKASVWQKS